MITDAELDRLGYYRVRNRRFVWKYEAFEEACPLCPVTFHWNDEIWSAQDWTKEPPGSLAELYGRRARQLREQYDYIILCLSGGADSENIMRTFDVNEIRLDEIVSWHDHALSNDRGSQASAEVFEVAIPRAKAFVERHPETLHTVFDIKEPLLEVIRAHDVEELLHGYLQSMPSIGQVMRSGGWVHQFDRYTKLIESGKRVCLLWGVDKTCVSRTGAFSFSDDHAKRNRKRLVHPELPVYDEPFYWSADLPQLVIKQCHVVRRMLDSLPGDYVDPYPIEDNVRAPSISTPHGRRVSLQTLNVWLYGWDASTFTLGKPRGSLFLSDLDGWVHRYKLEDETKKWAGAMQLARGLSKRVGTGPILSTKAYHVGEGNERLRVR